MGHLDAVHHHNGGFRFRLGTVRRTQPRISWERSVMLTPNCGCRAFGADGEPYALPGEKPCVEQGGKADSLGGEAPAVPGEAKGRGEKEMGHCLWQSDGDDSAKSTSRSTSNH